MNKTLSIIFLFGLTIISCKSVNTLARNSYNYNFSKFNYELTGNDSTDIIISGKKTLIPFIIRQFLYNNEPIKYSFIYRNNVKNRINVKISGIKDTIFAMREIGYAIMDSFNVEIIDSIEFVDHIILQYIDTSKLKKRKKIIANKISNDGITYSNNLSYFLMHLEVNCGEDIVIESNLNESDEIYEFTYNPDIFRNNGLEEFKSYLESEFGIEALIKHNKTARVRRYIISD